MVFKQYFPEIFSFVFIGEIQNTFALNNVLDPEFKKEDKIIFLGDFDLTKVLNKCINWIY